MRHPTDADPCADAARWSALLDTLESAVGTGGRVDLPDDIGPLPTHLLTRAQDVLQAHRDEITRLAAERDAVGAELLAAHRSGNGRTSAARRAEGGATFGTLL